MRLTLSELSAFLLAGLILTFSSCHQMDHSAVDHPAADQPVADHPAAGGDSPRVYDRATLVRALQEVRGRILSGDKAQLIGIFTFPAPSSTFNAYIGDTGFTRQVARHGDSITQEMFVAYFDELNELLKVDRVRELFTFLNPDSLLGKNAIEYAANAGIGGKRACYWDYRIEINPSNSHVMMYCEIEVQKEQMPAEKVQDTAGVKADQASGEEDESDDDPIGSCGIYPVVWEFEFDGKKLLFAGKSSAG